MKEKMPLAVCSVTDIRQHGHAVAFGPVLHEDEETSQLVAKFVKA
jgi:hypothetical protein